MYVGDVAETHGATVHRHSWFQEPPSPDEPGIEGWVRGEVSPLLDTVGGRPLLIAKSLGVGGTADKLWDGDIARRLSSHVLEVAGADHGMYVPGPQTESIAVLSRVVVAVEGFLDEIGWPS